MSERAGGQGFVERARVWAIGRPQFLVRRAPNANWARRGILAYFAGMAVVVVILGTLVLLASSAPTESNGPIADASSSSSAGANSPIALGGSPAPTPKASSSSTPTAIPTPTIRTAHLVAGAPCQSSDMLMGAGGIVYFRCSQSIVAVSVATNEVVRTYRVGSFSCVMACIGRPGMEGMTLTDDGLWATSYDSNNASWAIRFSFSGQITFQVRGSVVGGSEDDVYVFLSSPGWDDGMYLVHSSQIPVGASSLSQPAPVGMYGSFYDVRQICDTIVGVDPGQGSTQLELPDGYGVMVDRGDFQDAFIVDGQCWARMNDGGKYHLARLQVDGINERSPELDYKPIGLDGTLWIEVAPMTYQRLDKQTWQPVGPKWPVPCEGLDAAQGSVWCTDGSGRIDLPLD